MTDVPANTKYDHRIGFIIDEVGRQMSTQTFDCLVDRGYEGPYASYVLQVVAGECHDFPHLNLQDVLRPTFCSIFACIL